MALSQKQLFLSSQLFMASGKSNLGFDLSRFVRDQTYATETLGNLAGSAIDPRLQELVAQTIMAFIPENASTPTVAPVASVASVAAAEITPLASEKIDTRYIGRLR
jgi:hypothetical protein